MATAQKSESLLKKYNIKNVLQFINSPDYLLMCKEYASDYTKKESVTATSAINNKKETITADNNIVRVEISTKNGYIVNNKKVKINTTPDVTMNVDQMMDNSNI